MVPSLSIMLASVETQARTPAVNNRGQRERDIEGSDHQKPPSMRHHQWSRSYERRIETLAKSLRSGVMVIIPGDDALEASHSLERLSLVGHHASIKQATVCRGIMRAWIHHDPVPWSKEAGAEKQ